MLAYGTACELFYFAFFFFFDVDVLTVSLQLQSYPCQCSIQRLFRDMLQLFPVHFFFPQRLLIFQSAISVELLPNQTLYHQRQVAER